MHTRNSSAWIDIDNPPQVRYLLPFKYALEKKGFGVIVTARDYGITAKLLDAEISDFKIIGKYFGKSLFSKLSGTFNRALKLRSYLKGKEPDFLISSSRSSAITAKMIGIPSFIICDYEHSDLSLYKLFGSNIVYSDYIEKDIFLNKGVKKDRLLEFPGMKEQFTFTGIQYDKYPVIDFNSGNDAIKVLLRPPGAGTHYYSPGSGELYLSLLQFLSVQDRIKLIFFPRHENQADDLNKFSFKEKPYVITEGLNFISLYKSVDAVISSGGTMLREAVALDIPAYSIFLSEWGMVDTYLANSGKLIRISSENDFSKIKLEKKSAGFMSFSDNNTLSDLLDKILNISENVNK